MNRSYSCINGTRRRCGNKFTREHELKSHIAAVHNELNYPIVDSTQVSSSKGKDSKGVNFSPSFVKFISNVENEKEATVTKNIFECKRSFFGALRCDKKFTSTRELESHIAVFHNGLHYRKDDFKIHEESHEKSHVKTYSRKGNRIMLSDFSVIDNLTEANSVSKEQEKVSEIQLKEDDCNIHREIILKNQTKTRHFVNGQSEKIGKDCTIGGNDKDRRIFTFFCDGCSFNCSNIKWLDDHLKGCLKSRKQVKNVIVEVVKPNFSVKKTCLACKIVTENLDDHIAKRHQPVLKLVKLRSCKNCFRIRSEWTGCNCQSKCETIENETEPENDFKTKVDENSFVEKSLLSEVEIKTEPLEESHDTFNASNSIHPNPIQHDFVKSSEQETLNLRYNEQKARRFEEKKAKHMSQNSGLLTQNSGFLSQNSCLVSPNPITVLQPAVLKNPIISHTNLTAMTQETTVKIESESFVEKTSLSEFEIVPLEKNHVPLVASNQDRKVKQVIVEVVQNIKRKVAVAKFRDGDSIKKPKIISSIKIDLTCDKCSYPCNDVELMEFHKAHKCPGKKNDKEIGEFEAVSIKDDTVVKIETDSEIEYILP